MSHLLAAATPPVQGLGAQTHETASWTAAAARLFDWKASAAPSSNNDADAASDSSSSGGGSRGSQGSLTHSLSELALCITEEGASTGVSSSDGGVGVGPAAAAVVAAAGVRHWLRAPHSMSDLGNTSSPLSPLAPPTPTQAAPAVVAPPDLAASPKRAHFRLLCTLPDESCGACGGDADASLAHRHVTAVVSEDACVLSEETLRAATMASEDALAQSLQRRRPCGVALHLAWLEPPRAALLVVKPDGGAAIDDAMRRVARLLADAGCAVYVEPRARDRLLSTSDDAHIAAALRTWDTPPRACAEDVALPTAEQRTLPPPDVAQALDLVITLGGDGTLLWLSHLLGDAPLPPVLSFALGSLCFMTPFDVAHLDGALRSALRGGFHLALRHRLSCRIVRAGEHASCDQATSHVVLNEVVIDRGASPFLTNLETFCDGTFVTRVQGDGLIIATPSGSTAYNLAAGGSMLHPTARASVILGTAPKLYSLTRTCTHQVPGMLFTPICPHSLSFRPLVFPDSVQLRIRVPSDSRTVCWASFDGRDRQPLRPGDSVHISLSRWPMPTICARDATRDWFGSVRSTLHWNERRVQGVTQAD